MALTDEDIRRILQIIDESELDELHLETDGLKLHVRRGHGSPQLTGQSPSTDATPAPAPEPPAEIAAEDSEYHTVTAPMLGLFYRAPSPSQPAYVEPGTHVEPDTVIGLIEVMKLMNSVEAGVSGTVVAICAENAQLVEYQEPLIRVAPDQ